MTIYVPGMNTGPFGGPPGEAQDITKTLMQGILQGMAKRKEEQQREKLSSYYSENKGKTADEFITGLFSNKDLDAKTVNQAATLFGVQSSTDLQRAQAEKLRRPEVPETKELEYWKPDGSPGGKVLVSESKYNETVKKLQDAGYAVQKADKTDKWSEPYQVKGKGKWIQKSETTGKINEAYSDPQGWSKPYEDERGNLVQRNLDTEEVKVVDKSATGQTGEFERLLNNLVTSKKVTPEKANELISQRIQKLIESGGDKDETNKIKLGDGQKVTLAELRAQYREKYNIPDEFELQMMMYSPDPAIKSQAMRLKAEAATKPSFVDFMMDAKEKGLEGLRPESKPAPAPPAKLPPLPPGNWTKNAAPDITPTVRPPVPAARPSPVKTAATGGPQAPPAAGDIPIYDEKVTKKIGHAAKVEVQGTTKNGFKFGFAPGYGSVIFMSNKWKTPSEVEFDLIQDAAKKR